MSGSRRPPTPGKSSSRAGLAKKGPTRSRASQKPSSRSTPPSNANGAPIAQGMSSKPPKPPRSRRSPVRAKPVVSQATSGRRVGLFMFVGAVLVATAAALFGWAALAPGPGTGKLIELEWPDRLSSEGAAERLHHAGVVRSAGLTQVYLVLTGGTASIHPGVHLLADDMPLRTLLRRLRRVPGGSSVRVVIPEGYNKFDIARRVHEQGICSSRAFLFATTDGSLLRELRIEATDAEGYLFPATYDFARDTDCRDVVRRMVVEADRRYARVFDELASAMAELRSSLHWSKHDVITLASMIEKEAAIDSERPLIASVFLNRLRDPNFKPQRMLQSDPTARYGCLVHPDTSASCAGADGKVTAAMIHDPANSYSTYTHAGLPPGPIANPGEKSVRAVLSPAQTRYFFFVSAGNGRHTFNADFASHNESVRERR